MLHVWPVFITYLCAVTKLATRFKRETLGKRLINTWTDREPCELLSKTFYSTSAVFIQIEEISLARQVFQEFSFIQINKALQKSGNLPTNIPTVKCLYTSRRVSWVTQSVFHEICPIQINCAFILIQEIPWLSYFVFHQDFFIQANLVTNSTQCCFPRDSLTQISLC